MKRRLIKSVMLACAGLFPASDAIGQDAPGATSPEGLSDFDWSSIRVAYEAGRHTAYAHEDGFRARNPRQQWSTRFDTAGFTAVPDSGAWSWGLELKRYGFAGQERQVEHAVCITADGGRITRDWDDTLQEWYVNDLRGLEHGFTVLQRPPGADEERPLVLTLEVRGNLNARVDENGRGVRFSDAGGATALTYTGLTAIDADGRTLAAHLERVPDGLRLTVDEHSARYPLTIDPVAQQAYLKPSNTEADDEFGSAVAVFDDTVVVGAFREDSAATGVDGDQSDNNASQSGAAYIFVRDGTNWSQQAYLKASNTEAFDSFGVSVAIDGDTIVVGANGEDSGATGVNGDESDNGAPSSGAAYVFVRTGSDWAQEAYLKASNPDTMDLFGLTTIWNDTIVVAAPWERSSATGVDGDQSDNSAFLAGAAYVFVRSGTTWSQQAYLKASNAEAGDFFGRSASLWADTLVIGAPQEDSDANGVNGDETDNSAAWAGAAYVFTRSGSTWSQQAYLKASNSDANDVFGLSVSMFNETAVIGAPVEKSAATGVGGDESDNSENAAGAAYVFFRTGTTWSQQAYIKASNTERLDEFGSSVALAGDLIAISAPGEDSNATGVDGDQSDNSALQAGAAYVFKRIGTTWSQLSYLKASNTEADDRFGFAVALSDQTVVAGARYEDSHATVVDGDQGDNSTEDSGAAYIFNLQAWLDLGSALAGVAGDPVLTGTGDLSDFSDNGIALSYAAPDEICALFVSTSNSPTAFKGGTLLPVPWLLGPFLDTTSPTGKLSLPFLMPAGLPTGTDLYFQYGIVDAAAPLGISLSNAIVGTTP